MHDARVFPEWLRNRNGTKGNATTHNEEHDFNQRNLNYCQGNLIYRERSERSRPMVGDHIYYLANVRAGYPKWRLSRSARDMFLEIGRAYNFGREAAATSYSVASREEVQV